MPVQISTPLVWPKDLPHTPRGRQSMLHGFPASLTIEDALRYLDDELQPFDAVSVTLTTHVEHFASPRLRKMEGANPAIGVVLKLAEKSYLFACDRWLRPQDNIYAIVMTMRQIRAIDGYGVLDGNVLMAHFEQQKDAPVVVQAVVDTDSTLTEWHLFLGLGPSATLADANAVYRARARIIGETDPHALSLLNEAIEKARKHFGE